MAADTLGMGFDKTDRAFIDRLVGLLPGPGAAAPVSLPRRKSLLNLPNGSPANGRMARGCGGPSGGCGNGAGTSRPTCGSVTAKLWPRRPWSAQRSMRPQNRLRAMCPKQIGGSALGAEVGRTGACTSPRRWAGNEARTRS
jgi:hypothetical protein